MFKREVETAQRIKIHSLETEIEILKMDNRILARQSEKKDRLNAYVELLVEIIEEPGIPKETKEHCDLDVRLADALDEIEFELGIQVAVEPEEDPEDYPCIGCESYDTCRETEEE